MTTSSLIATATIMLAILRKSLNSDRTKDMPLQVQYESNLVDGGSSSPIYHTMLNGGTWGPWNVLSASIPMCGFQVVSEPGNVLAVYALGGNGRVYRLTQFHPSATPLNWNGWYGSGNIPLAQMQVLVANGQIVILGLGLDRKAYFSYLSGSSWTAWTELGGTSPLFLHLSAAVTHDNRIVVFAILYADDPAVRKVNYIEQTAPSFTSWGAWNELGTSPPVTQIACQATQDNRLAVFAIDQTTNIVQYTQENAVSSPGGAWSAWNELGTSPSVTQIACQGTPDNRLAVFVVDNDSHVQMIQQTQASAPAATWDDWAQIGATPPTVVSVAATITPDNRLAVFSIGAVQRTIVTIQQTTVAAPTTTWGNWAMLSGSPNIQTVAPIIYGGALHL